MAIGQQLNEEFQETLVEKTLRHRWCNSDSTEHLYTGQVVPGTTDWFKLMYCTMVMYCPQTYSYMYQH